MRCSTSHRPPSSPMARRLPTRRSSRTVRPRAASSGGVTVRSRNGEASCTCSSRAADDPRLQRLEVDGQVRQLGHLGNRLLTANSWARHADATIVTKPPKGFPMRKSICLVLLLLGAAGAGASAAAPAARRRSPRRRARRDERDCGRGLQPQRNRGDRRVPRRSDRRAHDQLARHAPRRALDRGSLARLGTAERPYRRLRLRPRLVDRGGAHPHDCAAPPRPQGHPGGLDPAHRRRTERRDRRGADGQRQGLRAVEGQAVGQDRARQLPGAARGTAPSPCSSGCRTPTSPSATTSRSRSRIPSSAGSASSASASARSSTHFSPRKARVRS